METRNRIDTEIAALAAFLREQDDVAVIGHVSPDGDAAGSAIAVKLALEDESFRELCFEGHRWFDLLRWGIAAETMAAYIAGETPEAQAEYAGFVKGKHELMPIPSQQIDLGAGPQNPGY